MFYILIKARLKSIITAGYAALITGKNQPFHVQCQMLEMVEGKIIKVLDLEENLVQCVSAMFLT